MGRRGKRGNSGVEEGVDVVEEAQDDRLARREDGMVCEE